MVQKQMRVVWVGWIAVALLVAACGRAPVQSDGALAPDTGVPAQNKDGYTDITVEQFAAMMANKDFLLINTHIPFEGDIPQTDLSIPFNEIADNLDKLPDKEAKIVLYCRSGGMSASAGKELARLGYTNVFELDGGMNAWKAAGYELLGQ
ncbi:MAG: rhodanese-like domain-containing protein [Anaerolineae bacterium]|nr:rhodanese-like domain-containing protein [Anaerolineae bacterium]